MNLNSLPDLCVQHILSFLPLRDLLRSHQVCRLWASLQRLVCAHRRQVTICIGDDAISFIYNSPFRMPYEEVLDPSTPADREPRLVYDAQNAKDNFDLLQFDWLDSVTYDRLVSLLPNVIELKVAVCQVASAVEIGELSCLGRSLLMDQIISLLTRWRSTLEAFSISTSFIGDPRLQTYQDHSRFLHAINQLDSLRRLAIEMDYDQNIEFSSSIPGSIDDIEPFQFSVSHLEKFSFLGYGKNFLAKILLPPLKHGEPESILRRISLTEYHALDIGRGDSVDQMGDWMRYVVHLIHLEILKFDREELSIFEKFSRLEYITIKVNPLVKIPQMLKYLESLRHLTYLKMDLTNLNMSGDEWDEIDRPAVPIGDPCLPSVRVLVIFGTYATHDDLHPFSWPSILPNLEILHFDDSWLSQDCNICITERAKHDCTKKALSPWTLCPRIRRIYSGDLNHPRRWNLSELRQYLGDEYVELCEAMNSHRLH